MSVETTVKSGDVVKAWSGRLGVITGKTQILYEVMDEDGVKFHATTQELSLATEELANMFATLLRQKADEVKKLNDMLSTMVQTLAHHKGVQVQERSPPQD